MQDDTLEAQHPGFYQALGRTVQVLRTDQGMDRKDLAARAGISYSYLAAIENGKKPPSSRVLFAIAEALGLRGHELLASVEGRWARRWSATTPAPRVPAPSSRRAWFHGDPAAGEAAAGPGRPLPAETAFSPSWSSFAPRSPAGFLMELERLSRQLNDEDREMVLGLARHLAGREG